MSLTRMLPLPLVLLLPAAPAAEGQERSVDAGDGAVEARPVEDRPDSIDAGGDTDEGAAAAPSPEGEGSESEQAPQPSGWWRGALGESADDGLYLGLWTLHLKRTHDGISSHWLVGIGWEGIYAKTFVNSFGDRSWGLGLHRSMVSVGGEGAAATLGLRAGVIRGYDERFHDLAGRWPVMPAAELVSTARLGRVGIQATWAAVVTSVGAYIPLGSR